MSTRYDAVLTNITRNHDINVIGDAVSKQCRVCTRIVQFYTWRSFLLLLFTYSCSALVQIKNFEDSLLDNSTFDYIIWIILYHFSSSAHIGCILNLCLLQMNC